MMTLSQEEKWSSAKKVSDDIIALILEENFEAGRQTPQ